MSSYDKVEKTGSSLIQHGDFNNRIYLMKVALADYPDIVYKMIDLAINNNYAKIFAKVPDWGTEAFKERGFVVEAEIPLFYNNSATVYFMSKYMKPERKFLNKELKYLIKKNINLAEEKSASLKKEKISGLEIKKLTEQHVPQLADVYKTVFKTYPFPIHETDYLKDTMAENVKYFGVFENDQLIAASSAEIDFKNKNAEMTDFATLPEKRWQGLANLLLEKMEQEMAEISVNSLYTIARAHSAGMNITFARAGYKFGGTLLNNTNISGNIESMNVWYKNLSYPNK